MRWTAHAGCVGGYAGGSSGCLQGGCDGVSCFGHGCTVIKDLKSDVYEHSGLSGPATSVKHLHTAEEGMVQCFYSELVKVIQGSLLELY